jgi:hypothetical protein
MVASEPHARSRQAARSSAGGTNARIFLPAPTGAWSIRVTAPEVASGAYTFKIIRTTNAIVPNALVTLDYTYDKAGNLATVADSSPIASGLGGSLVSQWS